MNINTSTSSQIYLLNMPSSSQHLIIKILCNIFVNNKQSKFKLLVEHRHHRFALSGMNEGFALRHHRFALSGKNEAFALRHQILMRGMPFLLLESDVNLSRLIHGIRH